MHAILELCKTKKKRFLEAVTRDDSFKNIENINFTFFRISEALNNVATTVLISIKLKWLPN